MTRRILAGALLATLAAATPAAAQNRFDAGSESATSGAVTATLTWQAGEFGPTGTTLKIERSGATVLDRKIPDVVCDEGCLIAKDPKVDLAIADLSGDAEPEVVVRGFTGGAHCCTILGLYRFTGSTYAELTRNFGSYGFEIRDLDGDGRAEIDALDVRFEDLFTSHAASYPPPRVFQFDGTRLKDVTRKHPKVVRENAKEALRIIRGRDLKPTEGIVVAGGFVSAYVADQYLLGRGSVGLKELDRQVKRGLLGTRKQAVQFRARLLRILRAYGYR